MFLLIVFSVKKYHVIFLFVKFCRKICHILHVHFNQKNISYYITLYDRTIAPIMHNVEKSKEALKNTGFEQILDVLFNK